MDLYGSLWLSMALRGSGGGALLLSQGVQRLDEMLQSAQPCHLTVRLDHQILITGESTGSLSICTGSALNVGYAYDERLSSNQW